jgi:hypothetical protein
MSEKTKRPPREIPWATLTLALLLAASAGLSVAGTYVLTGLGWALVNASVCCFGLAWVIRRGLD